MQKDDMILHFDWIDLFEESELTEEEQMQVIFAAIKYVRNGENPTFSDRVLKSVWSTVRKRVDHDLNKYSEKCEKNKENGKKGGRPKKDAEKVKEEKPKKRTVNLGFSEKPKKPDTDTDTDIDIDTDTDIEKDSLSLEREDWRERVFKFFWDNDFKRHPQEFIDYNLGLGHKFDKPKQWQAWARQWEAKG